ncbi:ATP-binding protein [Weissella kandleri]|uniref:ATP-binding protein n=1 Tax=Weissella kandleri TaxID=1616 RepID=UPI00387EDF10
MQIKRIEIQYFGCFQNEIFNLQAGLQVIYGLNETGKTTLHRFISGVLFGFPKARDTQGNDLNDGGALILEFDNQLYRVARRCVNKASQLSVENLTTGEQAVDAEKQLKTLLQPLNQQLYQAIYSFNQDDLLKIYTLDTAELNEVLRSVGYPGTDEWLKAAKQLQRQASQQLGKTKTAKRPLNQALRQLRVLQQQWNQLMQKVPDVKRLQQRQVQLRADLVNLHQSQVQEQVDLQEQNQLTLQMPLWEKIQRLKKEIQANPDLLDAKQQADVETTLQKLQLLAESSDGRPEEFKQFQQAMQTLRQIQQRGQTVHENIRQLEAMLHQLHEKWQPDALPAPLTVAQLKSLHAYQSGDQHGTASGETNIQKGFGLIGLLGLLLILADQWSLLGGGLMVSAGLYLGWYYWKYRTIADQKISLSGYENWDAATIELAQPDAQQQALWQQQLQQLKREEEQLIFRQQKTLMELRNLSQQPQADVAQLQKTYAKWQLQLQVQQTTQAQRQEYQALLQRQLHQLGLDDVAAYQKRKLVDQHTRALQVQLEALEQQLGDVDQLALAQFSAIHSSDTDTAAEQKVGKIEAPDKQAQQLQAELARVNYELTAFETDTNLETLNQKIATQRSLLQNEFQKYFVEQLSANWIQQTVAHLTQVQLPHLLKTASDYLQRLTQQKYIQIVDQQGQLKLKDQSEHFWKLDEVSRGTAELIYVTLRLAYAWQLKAQWIGPLLIDDAFVDFDEPRRQILFEILTEFATAGYQILYFTAHDNLTLKPALDLN